jgi:hypothetical protein
MNVDLLRLPSAGAGLLAVAASLLAATATGHPLPQGQAPTPDGRIAFESPVRAASWQHTAARAVRARRAATWRGGATATSTGETVNVYVSDSYTPEQHTPEAWAEFLAALPHGPELAALTAHIAPLDELQDICGPHSLGCYGGGQLYASGDAYGWATPQEIVRHEYGHHIANNRLNTPWPAVDWGPKTWATDQAICARSAAGSAYPGDEGDNYRLNPGEAWAESYRVFTDQRAGVAATPWEIVDPSFQPDAEAVAAVETDVLSPWTAQTTAVYRRKLGPKTPKVWSIPITTPLDGDLAIDVTLPTGGYHQVSLIGPDKTVLARGLWSSTTTQRIATTVCGQRSLTLRVTRRGAAGRVTVRMTAP